MQWQHATISWSKVYSLDAQNCFSLTELSACWNIWRQVLTSRNFSNIRVGSNKTVLVVLWEWISLRSCRIRSNRVFVLWSALTEPFVKSLFKFRITTIYAPIFIEPIYPLHGNWPSLRSSEDITECSNELWWLYIAWCVLHIMHIERDMKVAFLVGKNIVLFVGAHQSAILCCTASRKLQTLSYCFNIDSEKERRSDSIALLILNERRELSTQKLFDAWSSMKDFALKICIS